MIRYAVVGAGWISQEAFMPAVAATGNSCMQAIVSGSPEAARKLADFHGVREVVAYSGYDELIASDGAVRRMRTSLRYPNPTYRSGGEKAAPLAESGGAGLFVGVAILEVALRRKVVVDRGMN